MNSAEFWLSVLLGGSGLGGLFSIFLTRRKNKQEYEIQLIDRLTKEIERLDKVVSNLRAALEKSEKSRKEEHELNRELRALISEMETTIKGLRERLEEHQKKTRGGKDDANE